MGKRVGFLGPTGTFSHEALRLYASRMCEELEEVSFGTIAELVAAVSRADIEEALLPMENSIEGVITDTIDLLVFSSELLIRSELVIPVRQNLLVKKGASMNGLRSILSHPQPIAQCRSYLRSRHPEVELRFARSTADAARTVAEGEGDVAVIGSAFLAEIYGLDIVQRDIQDSEENATRFVVVAGTDGMRSGRDRSTVVFSAGNVPGGLVRILEIFDIWSINMTRIESRPSKKKLGEYIFLVDIEGHRMDVDVADALNMVRRKAAFFKMLGSYPIG